MRKFVGEFSPSRKTGNPRGPQNGPESAQELTKNVSRGPQEANVLAQTAGLYLRPPLFN